MPKVKRDANHGEISQAFENLGANVFDTAKVGDGFGDIVVGYLGYNIIVEIKTKSGKLSEKQIRFKNQWKGLYAVVKYVWEVTRLIRYLDDAHYTNTHNISTKLLETHLETPGGKDGDNGKS